MAQHKSPNSLPQVRGSKGWLKRWLSSRTTKGEVLLEDYLAVKIQREKNEAAEIAARANCHYQEKRIRDQVEVQEFIKALNQICHLPPSAQKIALAKLLEKNPGLAKYVQKHEKLMSIQASRLKSKKAKSINDNKRLLIPSDVDKSISCKETSKD